MKKTSIVIIVLLIPVSTFGDPVFTLSSSNDTPFGGETVTLTLTFDGQGLGLILSQFDGQLSGTGTWDTPTNAATLVTELTAHATATPGTPAANGVGDVVLAIDHQLFPWDPADIGAAGPLEVWSTQVTVHGGFGDTVTFALMSEDGTGAGAHVLYSDGTSITSATELASLDLALVPEPASLAMVLLGGVGVLLARRRRSKRRVQ